MATIATLIYKLQADNAPLRKSVEDTNRWLDSIGGKASSAGLALLPVSAAITGIGIAAVAAHQVVKDAMDTIRIGTGATGDALDSLRGSFDTVFRDVPASAATVATAIADLNTRTGATGERLENLATQSINLARITKGDLATQIANNTRLFGDWSVATADQSRTLDFLFKTSQTTGAGVDKLAQSVVQFGAPLRQMGFGLEESLVLLGKWEQEGVNAELVLGSLRIAIGQFADANIPLRDGLEQTFQRIQALGPGAEATGLAMQVFGKRAGPDMAAAILEGRFEIDALLDQIGSSPETINGAAAATDDWRERLIKLRNEVTLALEPIGGHLVGALERLMPLLQTGIGLLGRMVEWFTALPAPVQASAIGLLALLAAASPASYAISALSSTVGGLLRIFTTKGIAMKGVTALLGLLGTTASAVAVPIVALTGAIVATRAATGSWTETLKVLAIPFYGTIQLLEWLAEKLGLNTGLFWDLYRIIRSSVILGFEGLKDGAWAAWEALKGVAEMASVLARALYEEAAAALTRFVDVLTIALPQGVKMGLAVVAVLAAKFPALKAQVHDAANTIEGIATAAQNARKGAEPALDGVTSAVEKTEGATAKADRMTRQFAAGLGTLTAETRRHREEIEKLVGAFTGADAIRAASQAFEAINVAQRAGHPLSAMTIDQLKSIEATMFRAMQVYHAAGKAIPADLRRIYDEAVQAQRAVKGLLLDAQQVRTLELFRLPLPRNDRPEDFADLVVRPLELGKEAVDRFVADGGFYANVTPRNDVIETFWSRAFGTPQQIGAAVSTTVMSALTGGGNVVKAVGGLFGGGLGTSIIGGLSDKFSASALGGALGSVLPGLGTILGSLGGGLVSKLFGGLFGPSKGKQELLAANEQIGKMKDGLLQTHGSLANIRALDRALGTDIAGGWLHQGPKGLAAFKAEAERFEQQLAAVRGEMARLGQEGGLASAELLRFRDAMRDSDDIEAFVAQQTRAGAAALKTFLDHAQIQTQAGADAISLSLLAAWDGSAAGLRELLPLVRQLQAQLDAAGFTGAEGFGHLAHLAGIVADETAGPLLTAINAGTAALAAFHNAGLLTQDAFAGLTLEIMAQRERLLELGHSSEHVNQLMRADLQTIWQLQQDFGYAVDDATAALLEEAEAAGLVGHQFRSAMDRAALAMERAADALERIAGGARAAGGELDHAFRPRTVSVSYQTDTLPSLPGDGAERFHSGVAKVLSFHRPTVIAHKGLLPDEIAAILQTGEAVLNRRAVEAMGTDEIAARNAGLRPAGDRTGAGLDPEALATAIVEALVRADVTGGPSLVVAPASLDREALVEWILQQLPTRARRNADGLRTKLREALGIAA